MDVSTADLVGGSSPSEEELGTAGRAKVYVLLRIGDWEDRGTGHTRLVDFPAPPGGAPPSALSAAAAALVVVAASPDAADAAVPPSPRIVVTSEVDPPRVIVDISVGRRDLFRRSECIISYEPALDSVDEVAVSFADAHDALAAWTVLCQYFGADPADSVASGAPTAPPSDAGEAAAAGRHLAGAAAGDGEEEEEDRAGGVHPRGTDAGGTPLSSAKAAAALSADTSSSSSSPSAGWAVLATDDDFAAAAAAAGDTFSQQQRRARVAHDAGAVGGRGGGGGVDGADDDDDDIFPGAGGLAHYGNNSEHSGTTGPRSGEGGSDDGAVDGEGASASPASPVLPKPDLTSIVVISKTMESISRGPLYAKNGLINFLLEADALYLRTLLVDVFAEAEDLGDRDLLAAFREAAYALIELNDSTIVDVITSDGIFENVVAALECECGEGNRGEELERV
jgi:hypothetical protein